MRWDLLDGLCPHAFSVDGWTYDPALDAWVDADPACRKPSRIAVQKMAADEGSLL